MERAMAKTTDERIQNILRKKAEELEDTKQEKNRRKNSKSRKQSPRPQRNGGDTHYRGTSKTLNKNCLVLTST
jgi:hypothetical protein